MIKGMVRINVLIGVGADETFLLVLEQMDFLVKWMNIFELTNMIRVWSERR